MRASILVLILSKLLLCYFVCSRGQDRHPGAVKEFNYFFHDWEDLQCRSNGAP